MCVGGAGEGAGGGGGGAACTSRSRANNCKYLKFQKNIISDQIRKSNSSQALKGRFQRRKKQ